MDYRHFELHDLLCEALIALEGKDYPAVNAILGKALRWVEADWLATPNALGPFDSGASATPGEPDDDD